MAKPNNTTRRRREVTPPTASEQARDELFQHIIRCGVIGADPQHQSEWFADTLSYLADRYPELGQPELTDLRTLGERFAQPPRKAAETTEGTEGADVPESVETEQAQSAA